MIKKTRIKFLCEACLPIFASGIIAAGLCYFLLHRGISGITSDAWAYWEGSVSLLEGHGYAFFGGQPIKEFPPLFSFYLSAVQFFLGINFHSIVIAVAILSAATAIIWSRILIILLVNKPYKKKAGIIGAIYIGMMLGTNYMQDLFAEFLLLPFLGLLILSFFNFNIQPAKKCLYIVIVASVMLLTKNSAIAFLPGIFLLTFFYYLQLSQSEIKSLSVAFFVTFIPVLVWMSSRYILRQAGSHDIFPESMGYSPSEYFVVMALDVASQFGIGIYSILFSEFFKSMAMFLNIMIISLIILFGTIYANLKNANFYAVHPSLLPVMVMAISSFFSIWILFNLTYVYDLPKGRFLWHICLCGFIALCVIYADIKNEASRKILGVIFLLLLLMQILKTGFTTFFYYASGITVSPGDAIASECIYDHCTVSEIEGKVVIPPPDFPHINRYYYR